MAGAIYSGNRSGDTRAEIFKRDGLENQLRLEILSQDTIDWSFVENAALRAMQSWVIDGKAPPRSR